MVDPEPSNAEDPPARVEPLDIDVNDDSDGYNSADYATSSDDDDDIDPQNMASLPIEDAEAGNALPSLEEARSTIPHRQMMSPAKRNRLICYGLLVLLVLTLAVSTILLAVDLNKAKSSTEEREGLGGNGSVDVKKSEEELKTFLLENKISSSASFDDSQSSQSLALNFLSGEMANGENSNIDDNNVKEWLIERYVLVLIYYHFNGDDWSDQLNFLSQEDHCQWYKVVKTTTGDFREGVGACNDEKHVEALRIRGNNLKNKKDLDIPEEIRHLKKLKLLNLLGNDITGTLGKGIQHLENLEGLFVAYNKLHGPIPSWIGSLQKLAALQLTGNMFDGDVPDSISNLMNMRYLYLDDNVLSGNLDLLLKDMMFLEHVYVENNSFFGTLGWADNKVGLRRLDVSSNNLGGELKAFPTLLSHSNLQVADLHGNEFHGRLPESITENNVLQLLSLHSNKLEGSIPDSINALRNLYMLDLSFNEFTGIIPTFESNGSLQFLITSGNKFAEQNIPDLQTHSSLVELSMKGNKLRGGIPEWIGSFSGLAMLDLDANELTGPIPTQIGQLDNLQVLLLNRNDLNGTLPTEMASLGKLGTLLLDGNAITGNANAIFCDGSVNVPNIFVADCKEGQNGDQAQLECSCCTECCASGDATCSDKEWTTKNDPTWDNFSKRYFSFNVSDASDEISKVNDDNP